MAHPFLYLCALTHTDEGGTFMTRSVPALMMTAPASGQGKSMVTAVLARLHRNAGRTVRVFKREPYYSYLPSVPTLIAAIFNCEPLLLHKHEDKNNEQKCQRPRAPR